MSEFSEAALAKQAEADRLMAAGEAIPASLMFGIYEPATKATDDERCRHCGMDARPTGFNAGNGRFCGLCLSRGRDESYDMAEAAGSGPVAPAMGGVALGSTEDLEGPENPNGVIRRMDA